MSRDGYFFVGLYILIGTFCVCTDDFQGLSKAFHYLLILEVLTETLLIISFSVIGRCCLVPASHWLQGECARNNLSRAASGMILQSHRRLLVSFFSVKIAFEVGFWNDFQN